MDKNFIFARPNTNKMATYKKRGYKPKNKAEEREMDVKGSATAEVFSTLDESASKSEQWVSKNQNYILGTIAAIAIVVLGYLAYNQFILEPKSVEANNELYYPQQYFEQAQQNPEIKDSLFLMALNGGEGKYGLLDIIDEYKGTKAANIATYAAGMSYLNLQQYDKAIDYLEQYSPDEEITGALAIGGIGDAFMQLGQPSDALGYYEKALNLDENEFTTPRYLYKSGVTAMELEDYSKALQYFQRIKDDYPTANEAASIDALIGMAKRGN